MERNPAVVSFTPAAVGVTEYGGYVNFTNTGTALVNLTGLRLGGADAADFAIASNDCGPALNAATWCSISFTPAATGARTAIFALQSDAGQYTVELTGTGQ